MRCFFMRDGHIAGVEELPGLSDAEAVERSRAMFAARRAANEYDGFEVWQLSRMVFQHPPVEAEKPKASGADVIRLTPKRSG